MDQTIDHGSLGRTASASNPPPRPRAVRILHWLTVLCLIVAATLILTRDEVSNKPMRGWLMLGHQHAGLLVLLLFVIRVVVRLRVGKLHPAGEPPWLMHAAAQLTHVALYALLLAMPLLGWALTNASGHPVHFFGLPLPALVGEDDDLSDTLLTWHQDAAWVLLALALLHIGAALWHHFVRHDGTLRMMLPARRR